MKVKITPYSAKECAQLLHRGFIGALATGRAEAGPRALGNRSIIGDPRSIKVKERINGLIKLREAYQPIAPICLEEDFPVYFEPFPTEVNYNYMLFSIPAKSITATLIPAVIHCNGTARVQVVTKGQNEHVYELLREFKEITGIGILTNTSFNGKGEPIVNSARDAYLAYKALDLDFLVLGQFLIRKGA